MWFCFSILLLLKFYRFNLVVVDSINLFMLLQLPQICLIMILFSRVASKNMSPYKISYQDIELISQLNSEFFYEFDVK